MKVNDRVDYIRKFRCLHCGLDFSEEEFTTEDENGYDMCPACGKTEFEEI